MMFEHFSDGSRTAVSHAQQHARRLGHRYIGCEHILLALVGTDEPAGDVLRESGLTPESVEEEIVRRVGLGAGAGFFGDLDQDALASIGIDIDAVRARIEASFGTDALAQAGRAVHCAPRPSRVSLRRAIPPALARSWHRRGKARRAASAGRSPWARPTAAGPAGAAAPGQPTCRRPAEATGRYHAPGPVPDGHLPFTPGAKRTLQDAVLLAQARHDLQIGVEHVALGLVGPDRGLVPPILAARGLSRATLRAAIADRYLQAS
jgi:hypothetical protein